MAQTVAIGFDDSSKGLNDDTRPLRVIFVRNRTQPRVLTRGRIVKKKVHSISSYFLLILLLF